MSREDDVITSAGYRIGPSEIEDTLLKHPAVALSAVVGIPDPIRTEAIKAWIVLRPGFAPATSSRARSRISSRCSSPRTNIRAMCEFAEQLPMTATGKVLRRELRARG